MKLLLLHHKQLYADSLYIGLSTSLPDIQLDRIETIDELRSVSSLSDYSLVIVDTGLSDRSVLEGIRIINSSQIPPKILAIADTCNPSLVAETFKYQIMAYVSTHDSMAYLKNTVLECLQDNRHYTRKTRKSIKNWVSQNVTEVSRIEVSKREREILRMICEEKTSVEIAEELFISEYTVLTHRKNLLKKVSAKNTVGLVKYAIANKLLVV